VHRDSPLTNLPFQPALAGIKLSDDDNTRTLSISDISLGSLTLPALEDGDFVELLSPYLSSGGEDGRDLVLIWTCNEQEAATP
jgi:hypothetical protein